MSFGTYAPRVAFFSDPDARPHLLLADHDPDRAVPWPGGLAVPLTDGLVGDRTDYVKLADRTSQETLYARRPDVELWEHRHFAEPRAVSLANAAASSRARSALDALRARLTLRAAQQEARRLADVATWQQGLPGRVRERLLLDEDWKAEALAECCHALDLDPDEVTLYSLDEFWLDPPNPELAAYFRGLLEAEVARRVNQADLPANLRPG